MEKPLQKLFQFLYGPFFMVLDFFMRSYRANRARLGILLRKKKIASFLQGAAVAVLIIWLLIFFFSSQESRNSLTRQVKESFQGLQSFNRE